jgi:hypothetical protein
MMMTKFIAYLFLSSSPRDAHLRHTKALLINYHHEVHTHVQGKMIAELSLHIIMQLHKRVFIRTKLSLILRWSSLIGHVQKTFSNRLKQTRLRTDEARCAPTSKIKMNALQKTDNKKLQDRRCSGGE